MPKITISEANIPFTPPVNGSAKTIMSSTKTEIAKVKIAKYIPWSLVVGNAIKTPKRADIKPAAGSAKIKGRPNFDCKITTLYAPVAMKAECPKLT